MCRYWQEELEDAELMLEIAGAYMGRGMYKEAESVLSRSIPFADGPPLRAMLGDALYEQNELPAAVDNYLAVVQADGKYAADKADSNAVHCLGQLGKCFVTLGDEAAQAEVRPHPCSKLRAAVLRCFGGGDPYGSVGYYSAELTGILALWEIRS